MLIAMDHINVHTKFHGSSSMYVVAHQLLLRNFLVQKSLFRGILSKYGQSLRPLAQRWLELVKKLLCMLIVMSHINIHAKV